MKHTPLKCEVDDKGLPSYFGRSEGAVKLSKGGAYGELAFRKD